MAKQLNVNLGFTVETSQAKAQIQDLQNQLTNLMNASTKNPSFGMQDGLQKANTLAAELKVTLNECTNVNTGKLDLGKFSQSLKSSNLDIGKIQESFEKLGPVGTQAFTSLAKTIVSADIPMRNLSSRLTELGTTLKNTARWQISSSILHGFMGAISSAYGYAQDLNESLNNIRIVTGESADQMAKFAATANKAAQALSSTTTDYTNASLIYYQQGLTDEEVQKRTDLTIKMANVTGEAVETVSDQLTSIWNNFDDGSKSLESYVDIITALGAATASSTDEISEGLSKFSAVANQIGLSYEYATSALTTVTATTRQSADVVGTAFKTLFGRIQGLNLGETLDDGTTLNKYSEALDKVGINIKDENGQLKDMDTILDEMGSKWQGLSKDQQIALAQTVAGVRQYTQLTALMDHWDDGSAASFKNNLKVAQDSTGELNKQQEIYAEGWEAASKRAKAAVQDIYEKLLDDKFFIGLTNGFSKFLNGISSVIDGLGGLKGVLLLIGTVMMNVFKNQAAEALTNLQYNLQRTLKLGKDVQAEKTRKDAISGLEDISGKNDGTTSGAIVSNAYGDLAVTQQTYLDKTANMTESQKQIAAILLSQNQSLIDEAINQGKVASNAEKTAEALQRQQRIRLKNKDASENVDKATADAHQEKLGKTQGALKTSAAASRLANLSFYSIKDSDLEGKALEQTQKKFAAFKSMFTKDGGS